jgi:hypothetical protein
VVAAGLHQDAAKLRQEMKKLNHNLEHSSQATAAVQQSIFTQSYVTCPEKA